MNVLFLDSIEKETFGGMEEWIRLVASGLAERGHGVTVAGRPGSEFLRRVANGAPGVAALPVEISGDFHPGTIAMLTRRMRERAVDLVIVNFNKDVRLGGIAAKLKGDTPVIWSVGLDITGDSFVHRFLTPKLVDGVIVPSESLKRQLTRPGYIERSMVQVIPIGIPDTRYRRSPEARSETRRRFGLSEDAFVAVTVGRFVEQKGHQYLLEAIPAIVAAHPNVRFLWCGSGPLEGELRERTVAMQVNGRVTFAGMLDSVDGVLAGVDLIIHPSVEEPFGIAILEGMRAGLPIAASNVGGIPEVVGEAGILFEPQSSATLAAAVTGLLALPEKLTSYGAAARTRFETHFRAETMNDRIESYFQGFLQPERRRG